MTYLGDKDIENIINARDRHCRIGRVKMTRLPSPDPVVTSWPSPQRNWWDDPFRPYLDDIMSALIGTTS